jgi:hypothetical protein
MCDLEYISVLYLQLYRNLVGAETLTHEERQGRPKTKRMTENVFYPAILQTIFLKEHQIALTTAPQL